MERFFIVPVGLNTNELIVYYYISNNTNYKEEEYKNKKKFEFNISLRTAEKDLGITKKIISNTLKKLEEKGYISLLEKGKPPKTPSKYKLIFAANFIEKRETIKDTIEETIQAKEISHFESSSETIEKTIKGTPSNIYLINNNICANSTSKNNENKEDAFNNVWSLYPRKRGKAKAKSKILKILNKTSEEELIRAVKRYSDENKSTQIEFIKHGDTFFNAAYEDYLDCNYQEDIRIANYVPQATSFDY